MVIITQISIPLIKDQQAFEKFMKEEFIPDVYMEQMRNGKTFEVSLLSKASNGKMFVYYYLHRFDSFKSNMGDVSMEAMEKLGTFEPIFKQIGTFEEVFIRNHQKDEAITS